MRLHRIWLPGAREGRTYSLDEDESHHLVTVMRRGEGDEVVVVAGEDRIYLGVIESVSEEGETSLVKVTVGEDYSAPPPPVRPWLVAVSVVKERNLELAIRMLSETGLEGIIPLVSERGQVSLAAGSGKIDRWKRIALESAKQCGRASLLDIRESISIEELLRKETGRDVWIAHPGGPEPSCSAFLGTDGLKPSLFLIGPEGGFSTAEIALCEENGARLVGFPMPVMRTPVAVMMIGALGALVEMTEGRERADEDGVNSC
ncbi:MAG: RsmE family RNA methyltransferase [Planctomycetota bacterium]|jgi:16S rRNA (uracil1498-N3)-methyltransferase|nr:16S rRNA (uracil(1498)-N(3))-methyltransferase [Planctomycetota bacterium]MCH2583307.1 16S rRNA (uracil(1498)-N(3))-methyltransferase [Planctomycetota bacterium]